VLLSEGIVREHPFEAGIDGVFGVLQKCKQKANSHPCVFASFVESGMVKSRAPRR
jgi:hypothetical protein